MGVADLKSDDVLGAVPVAAVLGVVAVLDASADLGVAAVLDASAVLGVSVGLEGIIGSSSQ